MQQLCEDAVAHFRQGMVDLEAVEDAALQPDFKDRFYTLAVDTAALIEVRSPASAMHEMGTIWLAKSGRVAEAQVRMRN